MHGKGGEGAWQGSMRGRGTCVAGRAWMAGGVHGRRVCIAGGHAWQGGMHGRGACMAGGVHGRGCRAVGHAWQGVCMAGGCGRVAYIAGGCGVHAPQQILQDTVNEQAVCIILECILVFCS